MVRTAGSMIFHLKRAVAGISQIEGKQASPLKLKYQNVVGFNKSIDFYSYNKNIDFIYTIK